MFEIDSNKNPIVRINDDIIVGKSVIKRGSYIYLDKYNKHSDNFYSLYKICVFKDGCKHFKTLYIKKVNTEVNILDSIDKVFDDGSYLKTNDKFCISMVLNKEVIDMVPDEVLKLIIASSKIGLETYEFVFLIPKDTVFYYDKSMVRDNYLLLSLSGFNSIPINKEGYVSLGISSRLFNYFEPIDMGVS